MIDLSTRLSEAAAVVQKRTALAPRVGLVLGSGLGAFGDTLTDLVKIPYAEIPHMPRSTVVGHAGTLCLGAIGGVPVACLQGRAHLYEGHSADTATFAVRLLAHLGARAVLLTNAAGGIGPDLAPGDFMLITDHLNLMGKNPLVGPNDERVGKRFPDLTEAYDRGVREAAREAARALTLPLHEGVYAALLGPTYETPAEIRMLRTLGANAVGMSTVPEVIAMRHQGVRVGAISCITNLAAGVSRTPLDHQEVEEIARARRADFVALLGGWIERVAGLPA